MADRLDAVCARLHEDALAGRAPTGGVVGVARAGGHRAVAAFGMGIVEGARRDLRTDDHFLLTSVTKILTATQVLLLVRDGEVGIDDVVVDHLPDFGSGGGHEVTVRHLLDHTSGIDPGANLAEGPPTDLGPEDLTRVVFEAGLRTRPGERFEYCSPGWWVLADLVRARTGRSHFDDLNERIGAPLGWEHTGYVPDEVSPVAVVSPVGARHPQLAEQVRRLAYPAGGVVGIADDLLAFGQDVLRAADGADAVVHSPVMVRALLDEDNLVAHREVGTRQSLGWAVGGPGAFRSARTLWHWGGSGTALWVDPVLGITVVLLTADWHLPLATMGRVFDAVVGNEV